MTLTLILMRHAKSAWDDPMADDHDRVLNDRGRRSAPAMGKWLRDQGVLPDHVLVSSASRTQETLARLALPPTAATVLPDLYHAHPATILQAIRDHGRGERLLVIGHNPGLSEAAGHLVTNAPDHPRFGDFPTCGTLIGTTDGDWPSLAWGRITPSAFGVPREIIGG